MYTPRFKVVFNDMFIPKITKKKEECHVIFSDHSAALCVYQTHSL